MCRSNIVITVFEGLYFAGDLVGLLLLLHVTRLSLMTLTSSGIFGGGGGVVGRSKGLLTDFPFGGELK